MPEFEDALENWRLCLNHLLSAQVEAWRNGTRSSVGQLVEAYWTGEESREAANRLLAQAGLKFYPDDRQPFKNGADDCLAVPNHHPLLRRLFIGTKWAGDEGASVWSAALRQAPCGSLWQPGQVRVGGVRCRATLIPLPALYGASGIMSEDNGHARTDRR
jgi:hypothetical protein